MKNSDVGFQNWKTVNCNYLEKYYYDSGDETREAWEAFRKKLNWVEVEDLTLDEEQVS
jgi:hypothetical protein